VVDYLRTASGSKPVILPVHPRTRAALDKYSISQEGLRLIEPLSYFDMHRLMASAAAVMTDSGGVQKEAYFHRVLCVTLRDETEWVETVEAGWNRLWTSPDYRPRRDIPDYGDGRAGEKIVRHIADALT